MNQLIELRHMTISYEDVYRFILCSIDYTVYLSHNTMDNTKKKTWRRVNITQNGVITNRRNTPP